MAELRCIPFEGGVESDPVGHYLFGSGWPPFGVFDVILTYLDNLLW